MQEQNIQIEEQQPFPNNELDIDPENKKSSHNAIKVVLVIAGILFFFVMMFIAYQSGKSSTSSVSVSPNEVLEEQIDTTLEISPASTEPTIAEAYKDELENSNNVLITGSLQNWLNEYCSSYADSLKISDTEGFPLTIEGLLPNDFGDNSSFISCINGFSSDPSALSKSMTVPVDKSFGIETLTIFDEDTIEGGHGGPSFFLPVGESIYSSEDENIAYYAFLAGPDAGDALNETSVILRAIKKFTTISGDVFYISATKVFLEDGDPKIVEVLSPYMKKTMLGDDEVNSFKSVNSKEEYMAINTEIINKVFPTEESFKETEEFKMLQTVMEIVVSS